MKQLNIFLLLPEANPIDEFFHDAYRFLEEVALREMFHSMNSSMEWVFREKNAFLFYDGQNISGFLENFQPFSDEYLTNPTEVMRDLLSNADNWRDNPAPDVYCSNFILHGQKLHAITDHTLSEIAERKSQTRTEGFLLFNFYAATFIHEEISIIKYLADEHLALLLPSVSYANEEKQIYQWLLKNRLLRNFNLNPKHGENGKGGHQKSRGNNVSLLHCSKERAQKLLYAAIGDHRKTKDLFNFDAAVQKFIVFKYEGDTPQNQYHGFHLDNQNEVSDTFKAILYKVQTFK